MKLLRRGKKYESTHFYENMKLSNIEILMRIILNYRDAYSRNGVSTCYLMKSEYRFIVHY
jgi:hypothetical protein